MAIAQAIRWPFVGRGREVEEFEHLLTDTGVRAFVLAGPAGVGKTRIAREFVFRAEDLGHRTASVFASASASTVPLSAMAALVPADVQGLPPDELFARVRALVHEQRDDRRLVLFVDDVDQLDAASLALVAALVDGGDALLVATLREGATTPDVVGRWWRTGDGIRHDLDVLGPIQVDALLHLALGGPMTATARHALVSNSGGNPLYLRELVLTGIEQGALAEVDGVWTLEGSLPTSGGLAALVESRLTGLSDDQRALVERLALCQPLGLDDLLGTVPAEALENLEARSLIVVETDRRRTEVALAHPLHTAVIRESIPRLRARAILLDEVERIESRGARRRDDALRLAV